MRYRGFEIVCTIDEKMKRYDHENGTTDICGGFFCRVFPACDPTRKEELDYFTLERGYDISDYSYTSLLKGCKAYIDKHFLKLHEISAAEMACRGKNQLAELVRLLSKNESAENLYNTLSKVIGMTDEEIRRTGVTSLVPCFDRQSYAQTIAGYLIDRCTDNTYSGQQKIDFDEINEYFAVDLNSDKVLLNEICNCLQDHDILDGFEISKHLDMRLCFNMDFRTVFNIGEEDEGIDEVSGFTPQM